MTAEALQISKPNWAAQQLSIVAAGRAAHSFGALAAPEKGNEEAKREPGAGGTGSSRPRRGFLPLTPSRGVGEAES